MKRAPIIIPLVSPLKRKLHTTAFSQAQNNETVKKQTAAVTAWSQQLLAASPKKLALQAENRNE